VPFLQPFGTQAVLCDAIQIMQAIRDSEWEFNEIFRTRTNQEQNITLETPYYDVVRIKVGNESS
jgi:hypothetical protein